MKFKLIFERCTLFFILDPKDELSNRKFFKIKKSFFNRESIFVNNEIFLNNPNRETFSSLIGLGLDSGIVSGLSTGFSILFCFWFEFIWARLLSCLSHQGSSSSSSFLCFDFFRSSICRISSEHCLK